MSENPYDKDSTSFDADKFLSKLLKEYTLKEILDTESVIVQETQTLHSDMQTLVYENYNKFISATDTIRKMKTDFKKMEMEINLLKTNMDSITSFSEQITGTLQDTRQHLSKLSGKYSLLKRLQFLSTLPTKMRTLISEKNYAKAVQEHNQAQKVLQQYGDHPSFQGIQEECLAMIGEMKISLREEFQMNNSTAQSLTESGELLLLLGEMPSDLSREMLRNANKRLHEQIVMLQDQQDRDMIEFIDLGIEGFLSDLNLVVSSFKDMFLLKNYMEVESDDFHELSRDDLYKFVSSNLDKYLVLIQERVESSTGRSDSQVMLRALDRLYRRLLAMRNLCQRIDMAKIGMEILINAANQLCKSHLKNLKDHFMDQLSSLRLSLASSRNDNNSTSSGLNEFISGIYFSIIEKSKSVLQDLLIFLQPEWSFNLKSNYKEALCVNEIRENLLVGFLRFICTTVETFHDINSVSPPNLVLVLSKLCIELEQTGIHSLLSLVDEIYEIDSENIAELTHESELCAEMRTSAQNLIDTYVRMQGLVLSQMLRKSVETRDWMNCLEPRSVRAVMKRVFEELNGFDFTLNALFENGTAGTVGSDSSRKTHYSANTSKGQVRSNWSSHQLESSYATNIHRLFSERVEIFSSVEFNKTSILTGIIKISLKTLIECVRLKTLSKYGLQQIQVDAHYLQQNLWKFICDENLIHYLLDEVLGSAVHRCYEPILMEPNAVEIICERG